MSRNYSKLFCAIGSVPSAYMEEVEEIATRIIIMDQGKIIAGGTSKELREQYAGEKLYEVTLQDSRTLQENELYRIDGVKRVELRDNRVLLAVLQGVENLDQIISFLMLRGLVIQNITGKAAGLEMVFLSLTGRNLRN